MHRNAIPAAVLATLCLGMTCQGTGVERAPPFAKLLEDRPAKVGDAAAMLGHRFARLDGGTIAAKELPYKLMVVYFFTTWADAGILQAKAFSNLFERETNRGFKVLGVVLDLEKDASAGPFVKQFKIAFPVAVAGDDIPKGQSPFGTITRVPASYVFDEDGKLLGVWTGVIPAKEMDMLMDRHL